MPAATQGAPAGSASTAGGPDNVPTASDGAAPTAMPEIACTPDQVQIVWMVRNSPIENPWELQTVLPAFSAAEPAICLKVYSVNDDDITVKRQAMIAAGEPLHIWSPNWGGNGFQNDRLRGYLQDLAPLIERDSFDTSVFIPEALAYYQTPGSTWALPFLATGSYLFYNKALFDAAQVSYPPTDWDDPSWTWEKFVDLATRLTKNTGDINQAVFGASEGCWPQVDCLPMMWGYKVYPDSAHQTGFTEHVDVDHPQAVAALQARHDLIHKHQVAPDSSAEQALEQLGGAFASGRVAMEINGGWGLWNYRPLIDDPNGFCWGVAPLPLGSPDAQQRAVTFTDPWAITAGLPEAEREAAWTFLKFLVSEEQTRAHFKATGTPPAQTKLLAEYFALYDTCMPAEEMRAVFEGAFRHGRESSNHMLVRYDELDEIWINNLDPLWDDPSANAQEYLTTLEPLLNDALSRLTREGTR